MIKLLFVCMSLSLSLSLVALSLQNDTLETPLHKAVFNSSCRLLVMQQLLAQNCDPNITNISGDSALHVSCVRARVRALCICFSTLLSSFATGT